MRYPVDDTNLDGFGPDQFITDYPTPGIEIPWSNPYQPAAQVYFDPKLHRLPTREHAPCLPTIDLKPSSVTFLERLPNGLGEDAPSGVYRVKIESMGECLLKIVCASRSIQGMFIVDSNGTTAQFHGVENKFKGRGFMREAAAYRNLLHSGACAAGVVPNCYGSAVLDQAQWHFPGKHDWLLHFRDDPKPLNALVLEFLVHASKMTLRCITLQRAEDAMEALKTIHRAHVAHGDIHPRNLLVLPEGRVVWIDFDSASTWPYYRSTSLLSFQDDLALSWYWLYQRLVDLFICNLVEHFTDHHPMSSFPGNGMLTKSPMNRDRRTR